MGTVNWCICFGISSYQTVLKSIKGQNPWRYSYWRAGASQPIYIYPALMYAVMFYVILNKRKRLGDCVTFLASGTLEGDTMQRLNALS